MNYSFLRNSFKPECVRILFVGESVPQNGTFFYMGNSNLYRYTQAAFVDVGIEFSLEQFMKYGCWIYDVCDVPVNGLTRVQRRESISNALPQLFATIGILKPEFIIVVKKGDMQKIVFRAVCEKCGYLVEATAFNLPFPSFGNQLKYQEKLSEIIRRIL